MTLKGYIKQLLNEGKGSKSVEFQALFKGFGKDKINKLAQEILKKKAKGDKP